MSFASPELASIAWQTLRESSPRRLLRLIRERKQAVADEAHVASRVKIALLSAYTAYPFVEFLEQYLFARGCCAQVHVGHYDGYMDLLLDPQSPVHEEKPDFVIVFPAEQRCRYTGSLLDSRQEQEEQARARARELLAACATFHAKTPAEIILANFRLPGDFGLGNARTRYAGSDFAFTKLVNIELGMSAPAYVQICDLEFLGNRIGHARSFDARGRLESKQMASAEMQVLVAAECALLVHRAHRPPRKVLALDLDNTLWGGVIGEVGVEGIELGETSAVGEAFKVFQRYILALGERGVLLAVVSKNELAIAKQPFISHPEMLLRERHISAWRANWESKADNLKQISEELNVGLDSFVFVDDSPAEIAIVNQFLPEVQTVLLSEDPSEYVGLLDACRAFEPPALTTEDMVRTEQYRVEASRRAFTAGVTDMDKYLIGLEMKMLCRPICVEDVPRIAQLINKSNQFNLTTRRRSQTEVESLVDAAHTRGFSIRLTDRFGDYGLVSVVLLDLNDDAAEIDTWLMSCRVLKRQVEVEALNEIVRTARAEGKNIVRGRYIPTPQNGMVRDLLPSLGFGEIARAGDTVSYVLDVATYIERPTRISKPC